MEDEKVISIAKAAHQANKAWCEANDDDSQLDWEKAAQWQRDSAISGVKFRIDNPTAGSDAQHNNWMKEKIDAGWVYGKEKDEIAKTHHCIVPFEDLPEFQQKKDALFAGVVDALIGFKEVTLFSHDFSATMLSEEEYKRREVVADKHLRVGIDNQLQNLKMLAGSRERSLAITKLQEGVMWLGMDLKRLNEPNPYPNSYKPENDNVDTTADGLKL